MILQDDEAASGSEWVVVSRRRAYWRPELTARLESGTGQRIFTRDRQGVWLSALWHFPRPVPAAIPRHAGDIKTELFFLQCGSRFSDNSAP